MSLKNQTLLLLILSGVLTAGVVAVLAVAYYNYFPMWSTLCLMLCMVAAITGWAFYYVKRQKYLDSINHDKKRYGTGNRKNRRKG